MRKSNSIVVVIFIGLRLIFCLEREGRGNDYIGKRIPLHLKCGGFYIK